jgi:hypothetical protein
MNAVFLNNNKKISIVIVATCLVIIYAKAILALQQILHTYYIQFVKQILAFAIIVVVFFAMSAL